MAATVATALLSLGAMSLATPQANAASAVGGSISSSEVLQRAQYWIQNPPAGGYDMGGWATDPQGKYYRTDCSGYVSMALHLLNSENTRSIATSSSFTPISKSQLQPGDIMNAANGAGSYSTGHVVLFAGWVPGTNQGTYWAYSFGGGKAPEYEQVPYPGPVGDSRTYLPYHYKNLTTSVEKATASYDYQVAVEQSSGKLWTGGPASGNKSWDQGMMAGTSASIAKLSNGGHEQAFQANTGMLVTVGSYGTDTNWGLKMAAGTSPSIAGISTGGYEVAFQGSNNNLWTVGHFGTQDWKLGMMPGTSPSITALPNGGYEIAFQANTGVLYTVGTYEKTPHGAWAGATMQKGTSPSITALPAGGYQVAYHGSDGGLYTIGHWANKAVARDIAPGTSPSITAFQDTYEVAYNGTDGDLRTTGKEVKDWGLGMMAGTSPSITSVNNGNSYEVAMQSHTGVLWTTGHEFANYNIPMKAGTSPAIAV